MERQLLVCSTVHSCGERCLAGGDFSVQGRQGQEKYAGKFGEAEEWKDRARRGGEVLRARVATEGACYYLASKTWQSSNGEHVRDGIPQLSHAAAL